MKNIGYMRGYRIFMITHTFLTCITKEWTFTNLHVHMEVGNAHSIKQNSTMALL